MSWSRPKWQERQQQAKVCYVIIGSPHRTGLKVKKSRHHIDRLEPELEVTLHQRYEDETWFTSWFDFPGADLDGTFGPAAKLIRDFDQLTIVRGEFSDRDSLDFLRNSLGVVSAIVDNNAIGVFDMYAVQWWTPEQWLESFVSRSEFLLQDHLSIIVSNDDEVGTELWMHTRGMCKFARPDLQVKHVEEPHVNNTARLLHQIGEYLATGADITDGHTLNPGPFERLVSFVESPDDTDDDAPHFSNSCLEVCDYDNKTKLPTPGISKLLAAIEKST